MAKDLVDQFAEYYEKGLWNEALQLIISDPNVIYDSLHSEDKFFPYFINFADACVFRGAVAFGQTLSALQSLCSESKTHKILMAPFLEELNQESWLFTGLHRQEGVESDSTIPAEVQKFFKLLFLGYLEHEKEINTLLEKFSKTYQKLLKKKLQVIKGWEILRKERGALAKLIEGESWRMHIPWIPFAFPLAPQKLNTHSDNDIPIVFLEPLEQVDYVEYLSPYRHQEMIVAIETMSKLFQLLQFSSFQALLSDPKVYIYVLDHYPQNQFSVQGLRLNVGKKVVPHFMIKRPIIEKVMPTFCNVLRECLLQSEEDFQKDTPIANTLYAICKRVLFSVEVNRYGRSRYIPLNMDYGMMSWFDPHKGRPSPEIDLGPVPTDYLGIMIDEKTAQRKVRPFQPKQLIRLAHVVPQIVDGGHAPTRLLTVLCTQMDRTWFDTKVLSTERMTSHLLTYPPQTYSSDSSLVRGAQTISLFKETGVGVLVDETLSLDRTMEDILECMHKLEIDIAVFHGPDEINEMIAAECDVPIRIFFEHGSLPKHPCFDLLVLSSEETYIQNKERFRQMGMESCYLPFSVDVRKDWKEKPYTKAELGLPEESFVMTTISNHLDSRLSHEMCHAIGKILQKCPKAVYAPIGNVGQEEKFRSIFNQYGVNNRVIFLGYRTGPSQYARSFNLYLNEFPFGSCIGILDAMAAGCPVVSMYDENGPPQARYAAGYCGMDRVITSGKEEDYIDLACQLINDPKMYQEWSIQALAQYEKHFNIKDYVRTFELIIEHFIDYHIKKGKEVQS